MDYGSFLLGLSALITSITASIVTIITVMRKTNAVDQKLSTVVSHVDGRFDDIQEKVDRKIERNLVLEDKLLEAGIPFPQDRTDIASIPVRRRHDDPAT